VLEGFYYYGDEVEGENCEVEGCVVPTEAAGHMSMRAVNPSMFTCMHRACIVLFLLQPMKFYVVMLVLYAALLRQMLQYH
jgi:hypothetical protein